MWVCKPASSQHTTLSYHSLCLKQKKDIGISTGLPSFQSLYRSFWILIECQSLQVFGDYSSYSVRHLSSRLAFVLLLLRHSFATSVMTQGSRLVKESTGVRGYDRVKDVILGDQSSSECRHKEFLFSWVESSFCHCVKWRSFILCWWDLCTW